jgi:3-dehydroquinate synthase
MKTIRVKSRSGDYPVLIGSGLLSRIGVILNDLGERGKVMVVTQPKIKELYFKSVERSLRQAGYKVAVHCIPNGEIAKSQKELFRLHAALLKYGFERRDFILALGGGVTGDLAGFAAATYLRGIVFINAGTTLLAQVDSSIGGKTGINLAAGKNLVGCFYPPKAVISDIDTLKTLPGREFRASLAEVVKYGVIKDPSLFRLLEMKGGKILRANRALLTKIVLTSASIKAAVVSRDEFETKRERMILNFGHTFGHGFEQASGYRQLLHGEAVSLGMVCATRLAVSQGLFSVSEERRLLCVLSILGLPASFLKGSFNIRQICRAMMHDKKKRAGVLRFVLPEKIGKVVIRENINPLEIQSAIASVGKDS